MFLIRYSLISFLIFAAFDNSCIAAPRKKTPMPQIKNFSLIDAISRKPISGFNPIKQGALINLARLPTRYINIRANVDSKVTKSVRFRANKGKAISAIKSPFIVAGNLKGKTPNFIPVIGSNKLEATPFGQSGLKGKRGKTLVLQFTISNKLSSTDPSGSDGSNSGGGGVQVPTIPLLEQWQTNMLNYGAKLCNQQNIFNLTTSEGSVWYYDGLRVYRQISDYTNDPAWDACAGYVKNDVYLPYVLGLGRYNDGHVAGNVPGRRIFAQGLFMDFQKTADPQSAAAIRAMATKSSTAYTGGSADPALSPETAYIIEAYLLAEQLGVPLKLQLDKSVNFALGHLEKLTNGTADSTQPYQLGLTFEALIRYFDRTRDKRILPAIRKAADSLFADAWNSAGRSFYYIRCKSTSVNPECSQSDLLAPDLNLLIAPAYAWLWRMTGENRYLEQADAIWSGGVAKGQDFLVYGKQFSQNYRWSFDFVKFRSASGPLY